MISPGERFNAFNSNRLVKRDEGQTFDLGGSVIIGPNKLAVYTFFHLLNRSITNSPYVFWIQIIVIFFQLAISLIQPASENLWKVYDDKYSIFFTVMQYILRFCPRGAPEYVYIILVVIYSVFTISHFSLFLAIVHLIKKKKESNTLLHIFFYMSYLIIPIIRGSAITIFTYFIKTIFYETSLTSLIISIVSLIALILFFFMICLSAFAMGTSPSPNLNNPAAIWAPCTYKNISYEISAAITIMVIEFLRAAPRNIIGIVLICYIFVLDIPMSIYNVIRMYYINLLAYSFIATQFISIGLFLIVIIIISFFGDVIPFYALIVVWLGIPVVVMIIMHLTTKTRVTRIILRLQACQAILKPFGAKETNIDFDEQDTPEVLYGELQIKSDNQALFALRSACVMNCDMFGDLSLIKYCLQYHPKMMFEFLHMLFLVPNQHAYLQTLIDQFLTNHKPSLLQEAILFQIVTSISESSNELTTGIMHEISRQNLQALKCEQILAKFWRGAYKGDISQMSHQAFAFNRAENELNRAWHQLLTRYPFSTPVLKEYVKFLANIGGQHRKVEEILQIHPQFSDVLNLNDHDINIPLLQQSVEEAVNRRPISSFVYIKSIFGTSILVSIISCIVAVIIGFLFMNDTGSTSDFNTACQTLQAYIGPILNIYDDVADNLDDAREKLYNETNNMQSAIVTYFNTMPNRVLHSFSEKIIKFKYKFDQIDTTEDADPVKAIRLFGYYSRTIALTPVGDETTSMVMVNAAPILDMIQQTSEDELAELDLKIGSFTTYIPIFYVATWAVLLLVCFPIYVNSLSNLKLELRYILSMYLTIPRSIINKYMDKKDGVTSRGESKNFFSFSANIAHHLNNMWEDDKEEEHDTNVADGFKVLVADANENVDILPQKWVIQSYVVYFSVTGALLLISTVMVILFTDFCKEMTYCFHTVDAMSKRMIAIALVMHGITTNCNDGSTLTPENLKTNLEFSREKHKHLMFMSSDQLISKNMMTAQRDMYYTKLCDDPTNLSCMSLNSLFDYFVNIASNLTNVMLMGNDPDQAQAKQLRRMFNDILYPLLDDSLTSAFQYITSEFSTMRLTVILIFVVGLLVVLIFSVLFMSPVIEYLDSTIEGVKLPLKFIFPLDVADLPKIKIYLQGESDWKNRKRTEDIADMNSSNFLNTMEEPFAVFESDQTLLFANQAFYTIASTAREACVGLPLEDIFAQLMPFRTVDNHPFNTILDAIRTIKRGEEPQVSKIRTTFEKAGRTMQSVDLRVAAIKEEDNLRAVAVYIEDLSEQRRIEEKIKMESSISQSIIDHIFPEVLSSALVEDGKLCPVTYESAGLLSFELSYAMSDRDEYDESLITGCALLVRSMQDAFVNFPSITTLVHDPPRFTLMSVPTSEGQIEFDLVELSHFVMVVNEVFTSSTTGVFKLTAIIHEGPVTIIPIDMRLTIVETAGQGIEELDELRKEAPPGNIMMSDHCSSIIGQQASISTETIEDSTLVNLIRTKTEEVF